MADRNDGNALSPKSSKKKSAFSPINAKSSKDDKSKISMLSKQTRGGDRDDDRDEGGDGRKGKNPGPFKKIVSFTLPEGKKDQKFSLAFIDEDQDFMSSASLSVDKRINDGDRVDISDMNVGLVVEEFSNDDVDDDGKPKNIKRIGSSGFVGLNDHSGVKDYQPEKFKRSVSKSCKDVEKLLDDDFLSDLQNDLNDNLNDGFENVEDDEYDPAQYAL